MTAKLSSGSTTGQRCKCGADIYAYYETRWYSPGDLMPAAKDDTTWHWFFVCEWGHIQPEAQTAPEQLSLLEVMA